MDDTSTLDQGQRGGVRLGSIDQRQRRPQRSDLSICTSHLHSWARHCKLIHLYRRVHHLSPLSPSPSPSASSSTSLVCRRLLSRINKGIHPSRVPLIEYVLGDLRQRQRPRYPILSHVNPPHLNCPIFTSQYTNILCLCILKRSTLS